MSTENDKTSKPDPLAEKAYVARKDRRPSRYVKAQQRREAAKAKDNRFYGAIFSLVTIVVLFSLLISAVMVSGGGLAVGGLSAWAEPWVFGASKLEIVGLFFVGLVALIMWRRMKKG